MSQAKNLAKLAQSVTSTGVLASAAVQGGGGGGSSSPTITSIVYPGNDTAVSTAGGSTITLNGTNFNTGVNVVVNGISASVVTRVSSTQLTFTASANATGSYIIYVVNTDGSTGLAVPGLQYSPVPVWTTAAGSLGTSLRNLSFSTTVAATGDTPITYSVASGTLPSGITLNSSTGVLSGTTPNVVSSTTYNFTIRSTDAQFQDTDRAFSLTINPTNPTPSIDYLIVAGGGGAGNIFAGGGGAGGYRAGTISVTAETPYTLTIGGGGAEVAPSAFPGTSGNNGSNSSGFGIISTGGGGGGCTYESGRNGGSGGGGGAGGGVGSGIAGQGNNGGAGRLTTGDSGGGGGGGAGAAGSNAISLKGGDGGIGLQSSITGTATYYAGGGGGMTESGSGTNGVGGLGGGGNAFVAGTANTGGGAGAGKSGGSGIVVVRYADTYDAASTTGSPTVTVSGGYRTYKFTSSGSITF